MAKLPGLFQRKGVWTLRVMIPLELQPSYDGRSKIIESLKTGDTAKARVLGTARRAELLEEFERKRIELNPQKVERVTPDMARLLAERVRVAVLRGDEQLRQQPLAVAQLLDLLEPYRDGADLTIGPRPIRPARAPAAALLGPLDGIPLPLLLELADLNESMDKSAAFQFASQRVAEVLPMVKAEARSLGLLFDEKAPGAMDALRECLKAYRRARADVAARDDGAIIDTPLTSSALAIDSTGGKAFSVPHGLALTPALKDIVAAIVQTTGVTDARFGGVVIETVTSTNVSGRLYVTTASATAGATAFVSINVSAKAR